MKRAGRAAGAVLALGAAVCVLTPLAAEAQLPRDPAERARVIAQIMQVNATQPTVFDRGGNVLNRVGDRNLYGRPSLSPDGTKLAVTKTDLEQEAADIWILDVETGDGIQLTQSAMREGAQGAVWSPDGREVAYVALRAGYYGLYRQPADGRGTEELLYRGSAPLTLTEWSLDGRYLGYFTNDLTGGALFALPLAGEAERTPIELLQSSEQIAGVHFSPDARYFSYASEETGRSEIYARAFPSDSAPAGSGDAWRVSANGGQGLGFWRRDGAEIYYLAPNRAIMAVPVTYNGGTPEFGSPTVLWQPPDALQLGTGNTSISHDGDRIVATLPPPQLRQLTVLDRSGNVVARPGEPGVYVQPQFSPDGKRVLVMRNDRQTGNVDLWTFDVETGRGTAITSDTWPQNAPIWSPDGRHVAYVSTRESYSSIYRKAADGSGEEELLFRYTPGAGMVLTDWSPDGKFLTFYTGVLVIVPIANDVAPLERKEIDWLREEYDVVQGRFSPDGRFIAYLSNELDPERAEVYVRPFDPDHPEAPPPGDVLRVSQDGAIGMVTWRADGKEMYFLGRDWEVMAVDIETAPALRAGTPKMLFKLPGPVPGNPPQWKNVSADGEHFVFAMPVAPAR